MGSCLGGALSCHGTMPFSLHHLTYVLAVLVLLTSAARRLILFIPLLVLRLLLSALLECLGRRALRVILFSFGALCFLWGATPLFWRLVTGADEGSFGLPLAAPFGLFLVALSMLLGNRDRR
jgi:hypothetical protein